MEFIIGILIGFTIGATGVGGGTLMAPALVSLLGFAPRTAVATALLFSALVKVLASGFYLWQRKVDGQILAYLLYGGVPGAILGALILEGLRSKKSESWILFIVGIIIIVSAASSLFHFRASGEDVKTTKTRPYLLSFFSFVIGTETGFSSAGAGALGTVMLFNFTPLAPSSVVGTDLLFGLIISTLAGGIHIASCDYVALCKLVPAGLLGALIGSRIAIRPSIQTLRKAVLLCTIVVGALLLRRGISGIF